MTGLVRHWRAPLLGGIAIFVLSFPLLISHPVTITPVAAAQRVKAADVELGDRVVFTQRAREQRAALAAEQQALAAAAAAAAAQVASVAAPVVSAVHQAAPAPRPAPPVVAVVRANNIVIARLGLNQPVGWYSDCSGKAAVPRWGTWRWSCAGANNIYVMAHNPGVFTPILGLRAGDIIRYGDPSGAVHTYRVTSTTIVNNTQMWPLGATATSTLTLQTCWTWDGSRDFIVRAVEI